MLVTGTREWVDSDLLVAMELALVENQYRRMGFEVVFVHGDCPTGIDRLVRLWCWFNDVPQEPHPADWETHGKAAGPLRNQVMVDLGADLCIAFPRGESRGTRDCMRRAEAAGIPVVAL